MLLLVSSSTALSGSTGSQYSPHWPACSEVAHPAPNVLMCFVLLRLAHTAYAYSAECRVLAERKAKLTKSARRGSLQQNGIPVDRVGPTGFGTVDVLHAEPSQPDVIVAGQPAGSSAEPRAWGKMQGLTLGSGSGSSSNGAVMLPGAPGAQVRPGETPGPIAAAAREAQRQQTGRAGAESATGGFTDVFVDLPAGIVHAHAWHCIATLSRLRCPA